MAHAFPVEEPSSYKILIEGNRYKIVTVLNVNVFLDRMREQNLFTQDEAEEIQNSPSYVSRRAKAGLFLDILETKGERGVEAFMEIFEYEYPEMYQQVTHKPARDPPAGYKKHRDSLLMGWVWKLPELARDLQKDYDQNRDLKYRLKEMESILKLAQDTNRDIERENEHLTNTLHNMKEEKNTLERKLAESLKDNMQRKDESMKYLQDCLELQKEKHTLIEREREIRHEKDEFERQIHSLRNDLSKNSVDLIAARRISMTNTVSPVSPTSAVNVHDDCNKMQIKILQDKLDEQYLNQEDLSLRLQQANEELDSYQNRFRKVKDSYEKLKKEQNAMSKTLVDKEKRIEDYFQMIKNLELQKQRVEEDRNEEMKKRQQVSEEKFKLFHEYHELKGEFETLQSKYEQLKIQFNRNSGESDKIIDSEEERTDLSFEHECSNKDMYDKNSSCQYSEGKKASTLPPSFDHNSLHDNDNNVDLRESESITYIKKRQKRMQRSPAAVTLSDLTPRLDRTDTVQPQRGEEISQEDLKEMGSDQSRANTMILLKMAGLNQHDSTKKIKEKGGIQVTDDEEPVLIHRGPAPKRSVDLSSEESEEFHHEKDCISIQTEFLPHKPKLPPSRIIGLPNYEREEQTVKIKLPMKLELFGGNFIGIFISRSPDPRLVNGNEILSVSVINENNYSIISTVSMKHCTLDEAYSALEFDQAKNQHTQVEVKIRKVSEAESEANRTWMSQHHSNGDYFFIRCNLSHDNTNGKSEGMCVKRGDILKVTNTYIQKGYWQVTLWDPIKCEWTKEGIIPKDMRKYFVPPPVAQTLTRINRPAFRLRASPFDRVLPTKVHMKLPVILYGYKDITKRMQEMIVDKSPDYCICRSKEACQNQVETMKICQQKGKHVLLTDLFIKRKSHHWNCFIVICLNTERASPSLIHKLFGDDIHQSLEKFEELREDIIYETISLPDPSISDKPHLLLNKIFETVKRGQERVYWMGENQLDSATVDLYRMYLGDTLVCKKEEEEGKFRRSQSLPAHCIS